MGRRIVMYDDRHTAYYGAQRGMVLLARGLKALGWEPVIILGGRGRYAEEVEAAGLRLEIVPMPDRLAVFGKRFLGFGPLRALQFYGGYAAFALRLARVVGGLSPDLLYANNVRSVPVLLPSKWITGRKLVWYVRSGKDPSIEGSLAVWAAALRAVDKVVLIARENGDVFSDADRARFAERIVVNNSGIAVAPLEPADKPALRVEFGLPTDQVLATCVASMAWRKGQDVLLEALRRIVQSRGRAPHVCLVGAPTDPPSEAYTQGLKSFAAEHDLPVTFLGWTDRVADLLAASDLYVLPSRNEGLSRSILEAMVAGLPVVSTDAGGAREQVIDGETGFIVGVDDAEAMAGALARLTQDEEMRRRLGHAGYARVRSRFSLESYVDGFAAIAAELAPGR